MSGGLPIRELLSLEYLDERDVLITYKMFAGILVQFAEWQLQSIGDRRPYRAPVPVTVASVRAAR